MTAASLEPHPGPVVAPAAATGTGLRSATCWRYRVPSGTAGPVELEWTGTLAGTLVPAGSVLDWVVLPAFDEDAADVRDGFRAAATTLDLELDDGTRLSATAPVEVGGLPSAARARADVDSPDQWNHRRVPLDAVAGRTIRRVLLVVDPGPARDATGPLLEGWVDGPRVVPGPGPVPVSPTERVLTTRGTHSSPWRSRGNTVPLAGVPHGGVHLAPATDLSNPHWTYTWNAHGPGHRPRLHGLVASRAPSIWIGERAAVAFRVGLTPDPEHGVAPEELDHDDEHARPHEYRVRTLSGIGLHGTATDHALLVEADLPRAGRLVVTAPGAALAHAERVLADGGAEGDPEGGGAGDATGGDAGGVHLHVASVVPSPHEPDPVRGYACVRVTGADVAVVAGASGGPGDVVLDVRPRPGAAVRLECGTSTISVELAAAAREREVAGRSVAELAADARDRWDALLGLVEAPGAEPDDQALLASDLHRLFLFPTRHHERTPDGPAYVDTTVRDTPDSPTRTGRRVRSGRFLTDNGFWDTYRTAWPAYHLLVPDRAGALLDGFLEQVRASGWSARWSAGSPLDAMVGTSLDVIAADAVSSGVPGVDLATAYRAALRNATCASADPRFGRKGMPAALFRGYVDASVEESVSWTLEGCIADAGAAVLARELARRTTGPVAVRLRAEARLLAARALDHDRLHDPGTGFTRPRDAAGRWADEPFDPRRWGGGHTETNAWGSRFGAPHDPAGAARLAGGPAALGDALDAYFREPETARADVAGSYGTVIHEMPEARDVRRGMWAPSNQPAHHVPGVYAATDRPWRAAEVLRSAVDRLFLGLHIGQGYPGDEDNGEMSAWRLFCALGLYPFQPGSGRLLIGVPAHPAVIRPHGGAPVHVRPHERTPGARHIRSVRVDGREWTSPFVDVQRLRAGALIDVELGDTPVAWAEPLPATPYFAPDDGPLLPLGDLAVRADLDGRPAPGLVDDQGDSGEPLRDGSVLEVRLRPGAAAGPALLTLTLRDPGEHAFTAEARGDGAWHPLGRWDHEPWDWPAQTRPFALELPGGTRAVRVRWHGAPAQVAQVQVLAPR